MCIRDRFDRLDTTLRLSLKSRGDNLVQAMSGYMRQLNKAEESFQDDERGLEREAMTQVLTTFFNPIEQRMLKACPCLLYTSPCLPAWANKRKSLI